MLKETDDEIADVSSQDNSKRNNLPALNIASRFTDHAPSMERPWKKSLQPGLNQGKISACIKLQNEWYYIALQVFAYSFTSYTTFQF